MNLPIEQIGDLLLQYKYWIIFPVALIDGPIIIMLAGLSISLGYLSFLPTYIVVVVADVMGDFLRYSLGRWGGHPFIRKWGKYLRIDDRHVEAIEKAFEKRTGTILFVAKFAYGIGSVFHAAAGIAKVPISTFFSHNTLASLPKSAALLFIGYYFGHSIRNVNSYLEIIGSTLIVVLIVGVFIWAYRFGKKNKAEFLGGNESTHE